MRFLSYQYCLQFSDLHFDKKYVNLTMRSFRLKLFYIETDTFREYPILQRETDTLKYSEIVIIVILKILLII